MSVEDVLVAHTLDWDECNCGVRFVPEDMSESVNQLWAEHVGDELRKMSVPAVFPEPDSPLTCLPWDQQGLGIFRTGGQTKTMPARPRITTASTSEVCSPRVITTVDELNALPELSVVQEMVERPFLGIRTIPTVWQKFPAVVNEGDGWRPVAGTEECRSADIDVPVRVLWEPEVTG